MPRFLSPATAATTDRPSSATPLKLPRSTLHASTASRPIVSASLAMTQPPVKTSAVRASTYDPRTELLPAAASGARPSAITATADKIRFIINLLIEDYSGMSERVGFIGLGVMGRPMAKHLVAKGHHVVVYSRSQGPVDELVAAGATAAATAADVARHADIVITMLPDTADVELVLTGPDGVLSGLKKGAI